MKPRLAVLSALFRKPNMNARQNAVPIHQGSELHAPRHYFRYVIVLALALAGAIGSLGVANTANADTGTLYSASFEQPKFLGGEQLVGLDGWSTGIQDFLNPMAAKITGAAARRGEQSVEVRGAVLNGSSGNTSPYDAVGSYRIPLNYTVDNRGRVRIEADLLLDTNQPVTPGEFFSLTIAARSGDGETLGEIGLSSEGLVQAFDFDVAPGSQQTFSATTTFNRWHRVAILLDYANRTTSYFIDGQPLGTIHFARATGNVLARASMVVYARPDGDISGPASLRSSYVARFDNFRVNVGRAADDDKDSAE